MYLYLWLVAMMGMVVLEALWRRHTGILLIPGATVAMLMAAFRVRFLYQIFAFSGISFLILLAFFFLTKRKPAAKTFALDAMIGEKATVVEAIENLAGSGEVEVLGRIWSARAIPEETVYKPGEELSVVAVEGVTLICKK